MSMLRAFQNASLKSKVVAFTLGLFLLSIAALTFQFSVHMRQEMEISFSSQQFSEVSFVAERIDNAVQLRIDALALVAESLPLQTMTARPRVESFLAERKALYKLFSLGVIVIARDGRGIADYPHVDGRGGADYSEREFFRQIIATGKPALSKPSLGRFIMEPRLVIAVPILDKSKHIAGVLAGIASLGDNSLLSSFDAQSHPDSSSYLIASPRDNLYVADTEHRLTLQPLPAPGHDRMHDRYMGGYEGSG